MLTLCDIFKMCSMIQRLNSYNLLTDKVAEKVPQRIYRPDKKSKKSIRESEMHFPSRTILKLSSINLASVSVHVRRKQFNLLT